MSEKENVPVRLRVRAHRARLRSEGLRPLQIWVPDVRSPHFVSEAHRQSELIAATRTFEEDRVFIEALSADAE